MKKFIILLVLIVSITSCSSDEEVCYDMLNTIVDLVEAEPNTWSVSYRYHGYNKYLDFAHTSGVVLTKRWEKEYSFHNWNEAEATGWNVSKPHAIKLSSSESSNIDETYELWDDIQLDKKKCEVSNLLK